MTTEKESVTDELKRCQRELANAEVRLEMIRSYAASCAFGGWRQKVYDLASI